MGSTDSVGEFGSVDDAIVDAVGEVTVAVVVDVVGGAAVGAAVDVVCDAAVGAAVDVVGGADVGAAVDVVGGAAVGAAVDVVGGAAVGAAVDVVGGAAVGAAVDVVGDAFVIGDSTGADVDDALNAINSSNCALLRNAAAHSADDSLSRRRSKCASYIMLNMWLAYKLFARFTAKAMTAFMLIEGSVD